MKLDAIMARKGYESIEDFRGQLKDFDKKAFKEAKASRKAKRESSSSSSSSSSEGLDLKTVLLVMCFAVIAYLLAEREGLVLIK